MDHPSSILRTDPKQGTVGTQVSLSDADKLSVPRPPDHRPPGPTSSRPRNRTPTLPTSGRLELHVETQVVLQPTELQGHVLVAQDQHVHFVGFVVKKVVRRFLAGPGSRDPDVVGAVPRQEVLKSVVSAEP